MILHIRIFIAIVTLVIFSACSGQGGSGQADVNESVSTDTIFTIHDESDLIGGPVSQGRVGDILLQNDKIRVIIQKSRKNSSINSFGGNIIDADIIRQDGSGQDNFGAIFPLVNIEWTVNNRSFEVISSGKNSTAKIVRAHGVIDVYDYLDLDFIGDVAEGITGQRITFPNRFDDRRNPFAIYDDLKSLSTDVVTDFILEPGKNYVKIETTFTNNGGEDASFPFGQFMNGSGQNSMLVPGVGFSPDLMTQIGANTPAVIYAAFEGVDVSYGYFFPAAQFMNEEKGEVYTSTSVSYSGVTGLIMGEEFLKLAPLGSGGTPEINFKVPAGGQRKITGYFVVGGGSAGEVMDAGLEAIGAIVRPVSGVVTTADDKPVSGATVAVMSKGQTLITYTTDKDGKFSGNLPTGGDLESKRFGNGKYTVAVDLEGHHKNGTSDSGVCDPQEIDVATRDTVFVKCILGETTEIVLSSPVSDADTKKTIVARLTIVGTDPSPNKVGAAGRFRSVSEWEQPFGIVGIKNITAKGTFDLTGEKSFHLEPGVYRFVISHGPEYTQDDRLVELTAGGQYKIENVKLKRVVATNNFISSDFHVHSITSPDSSLPQELRVLSAAAEGLDIIQSSDHDYITDYAPIVEKLEREGVITPGSLASVAGDEVTPNHYGHLNVFPLTPDPNHPEGGAPDWSNSNQEEISPAPDYIWTLDELVDILRGDPGEEVIQINHILDNPTGLLAASGWVTTPFYEKDFGVKPFSSYADPVERRMPASSASIGTSMPFAFGTSGLVTKNFSAVELSIGCHLHDNSKFFRSALPTWFNLLNSGSIVTATADSDSHLIVNAPIGMPRNFILSSTDPLDGKGGYDGLDKEEYAKNINEHHVTLSAGAFVIMSAVSEDGSRADIGDTITGRKVKVTVDVKAPSWGWFDTIDIYANTEPIPADDTTDEPMKGTAADPATFYKAYHIPRYAYEPVKKFKLSDGTLEGWKEEDGLITASVTFEMNLSEDTWIVALAYGTRSTKGYKSLFPMVPIVMVDEKDTPETFDPAKMEEFHTDKRVGASAWGMTNPIFVDVDGDGFTSKYTTE